MAEPSSPLRKMTKLPQKLPEVLGAMRPIWNKVAEDASLALSEALDASLTAKPPQMKLTGSDQYKKLHPDPGIVLPLHIQGKDDFYARIDKETAFQIANLLLKACDQEHGEDDAPAMLDALLLQNIYQTLLGPIKETFGIRAEPLKKADPILEWPVTVSEKIIPFFVVEFEFVMKDGPSLLLEITLPPEEKAFAKTAEAAATPAPALTKAAAQCAVTLSATLDHWEVMASDVLNLRPGSLLPLKGASLDNLSLTVPAAHGLSTLAHGEHGRSKGRQAIQVVNIV
ncbi:MAG: FliM/FliN family flagellar motor C-terminal domain-containing protein [Pseudomonadota bacterium]